MDQREDPQEVILGHAGRAAERLEVERLHIVRVQEVGSKADAAVDFPPGRCADEPHVIDTLLLVLGVAMAFQLGLSPVSGWLGAKLVGLLVYIGFGVLTLRAKTTPMRVVGFAGAILAVGYVFAVAFSRDPSPF